MNIFNSGNRGEAGIFLGISNSLSLVQTFGEKSFFSDKEIHICYMFRPSLVVRGGGSSPQIYVNLIMHQ